MVLKCADIGHLAADPATHKRWSLKLEEEFFRQVRISTRLPLLPLPGQLAFCIDHPSLPAMCPTSAHL